MLNSILRRDYATPDTVTTQLNLLVSGEPSALNSK